jgi:ribosome-binding protein aMBF1 (putative translation factor)
MSELEKKIADLVSESPQSSWKEKVEWRKANKAWLRKSAAIAFRILDALDDLGWNKAKLAKEMGVSPQQVSKYVKGEENFKLETLCKLEKVLGVEFAIVLQEDEEVVKKGTLEDVESDNQETEKMQQESRDVKTK